MSQLLLPSVRVGLLEIDWTNGSREKPANPIPQYIIDGFEYLPNMKVDWISNTNGLITLKGQYNYLIYNENQYYFMEKVRVIDINKQIFVYGVTKDHWMSWISKRDNYIKGSLTKTTDEGTLWGNIQRTRAAITEVNSETVIPTCSNKCVTGKETLNINYFKRNEKGELNQFGYKLGFFKEEFDAFVEKLSVTGYDFSKKEPNQIFSYCKLRPRPRWENYIASLLEEYLKDDPSTLVIAEESDLGTVSGALKTFILQKYSEKVINIITKVADVSGRKAELTNLKSKQVKNRYINKLDLSQITSIKYIDNTTLEQLNPLNKKITDLLKTKNPELITKDNSIYSLKAKMYGQGIDFNSYKDLPISNKIYKKEYKLNSSLMKDLNLEPENINYNAQGINFNNYNVPAFYYPTWTDVINSPEILKIVEEGDYSTEVGYLLNNISKYEQTVLKGITNKFVYNGSPIYITTGLKIDKKLPCSFVYDPDGNLDPFTQREVSFSDVYRNEIEKSLWMTLMSVHLWWGEMGRPFVGLAKGVIDNKFVVTEVKCNVDIDGEVLSLETNSLDEDKLPNYVEETVDPSTETEKFKNALKLLTERRDNVEIREQVFPGVDKGDIYWSSLSYGLFKKKDGEFSSKSEFLTDLPALVIYLDHYHEFEDDDNHVNKSNSGDWKFKAGLLVKSTVELNKVDEENIITTNEGNPEIYFIRPLLKDQKDEELDVKYHYEKFSRDLVDYIKQPKWINDTWVHFRKKDKTSWEDDYPNVVNFGMQTWWPRKTDGNYALIKRVVLVKEDEHEKNIEETRKYLDFECEEGHGGRFGSKGFLSKGKMFPEWLQYFKENFTINKYRTSKPRTVKEYVNWPGLTGVKNSLKEGGDQKANLISYVYNLIGNEKDDSSLTYIDEEYLKKVDETTRQVKTHLFLCERGNEPYFYILLSWPSVREKPTIDIIIADPTIIENESESVVTLIDTASLVNRDLVQVVNQQNLLYVYGQTFPINTKIVTADGRTDINFRVLDLSITDKAATHYRLLFKSERDFIRANITVLKKDIANTIGTKDEIELTKLRVEMIEAAERRKFTLLDLKEKERLTAQNIRNQQDDLAWDQGMLKKTSALSFGSTIASGVLSFGYNPAGALISTVTGLAGNYLQNQQQTHQLDIKQREIEQLQISSTFQLEQEKNRIDSSHKAAEMNEKTRIYQMINNFNTSTPSEVDILEATQKIDTGGKAIVILNRMPVGELLEMLRDYHKNYGFDITLDRFSIKVKDINNSPWGICQFNRIDNLSEPDLATKEIIKNNFLNGVYFKRYEYKLNYLSYGVLKKRKEDDRLLISIQKSRKAKEDEDRRLKEIEAAERGKKQAEEEFAKTTKELTKLKEDHAKLVADKTQVDDALDKCNINLKFYDEKFNEEVDRHLEQHRQELEEAKLLKVQIDELNEQITEADEDLAEKEKELTAKSKEVERLSTLIDQLNDKVDAKEAEIQEAKANLTQANSDLQAELVESKKKEEIAEKLRNTYNQLIDEHKKKLDELKESNTKKESYLQSWQATHAQLLEKTKAYNTLEGEKRALETQSASLQRSVDSTNEELARVKGLLDDCTRGKGDISTLTKRYEDLSNEKNRVDVLLATLKEEKKEVDKQLKKQLDNLVEMKKQWDSLVAVVPTISAENVDYMQVIPTSVTYINQVKGELNTCKNSLTNKDGKISSLETSLSAEKGAKNVAVRQCDSIKANIRIVANKVPIQLDRDNTKVNWAATLQRIGKKIDELKKNPTKAQFDVIKAELDALKVTAASATTPDPQLQKKLDEMTQNWKDAEQKWLEENGKYLQLSQQYTAKLRENTQLMDALNKRPLKSDLDVLQKQVDEANKKVAETDRLYGILDNEKLELEEKVENLESQIQALKKTGVSQDNARITLLESQLDKAKKDKDAALTKRNALQTQLNTMRNNYNSVVADRGKVNADLDKARKDLSDCQGKIADCEDVAQLRRTYDALVDQHKITEGAFKEAVRQKEQVNRQLVLKTNALNRCEAKVKSPEEEAREYKVEREQKIKDYVHRVCELLKLCDNQWRNIFNTITDNKTYIKIFDGKRGYQYGNNLKIEIDSGISATTKSGTWGSSASQRQDIIAGLHIEIHGVDGFTSFQGNFMSDDLPSIHVNGYEASYFGFRFSHRLYKAIGVFSNSNPGRFIYYISMIICHSNEIIEIARKIDQFFTTDNAIAKALFPDLETDQNYKKLFREAQLSVITNPIT